MYVLIGEKHTAISMSYPRPRYLMRTEIRDEPVALFTTKKKALEYAESVTLVDFHREENGDGWRRFFKNSLLHGFDSYRVHKQWKNDLPTNPRSHKRVRR